MVYAGGAGQAREVDQRDPRRLDAQHPAFVRGAVGEQDLLDRAVAPGRGEDAGNCGDALRHPLGALRGDEGDRSATLGQPGGQRSCLGSPHDHGRAARRADPPGPHNLPGRLDGHYPVFIAPTSSCAKPAPSAGLHVSTLISGGPCRLLRTPCWEPFFPTLSLQVFPRMLEP